MTRKSRSNRNQPKIIAKLLNNALATGDTIAFVKAIGGVTRAQGMTKVSQEITFAEMRETARAGCLSIAPTIAAATRSRSAAMAGPMMSGCPI